MTDVCSVWAYEEIIRSGYLGKRQAVVLEFFIQAKRPMTATQAVENFGRTVSETTRTRISELTHMGFLRKIEHSECELTGKIVNKWVYTGRRAPKPKRLSRVTCLKCAGTGVVETEVYYDEGPEQGELIL